MNIGKLLTKSATNFPDNLAIAHGATKLDYASFNARANQLAHALRRLGLEQLRQRQPAQAERADLQKITTAPPITKPCGGLALDAQH